MRRLVVVCPLSILRRGDGFRLDQWPLHVTVAPTFVIGSDLSEAISALEPALAGQGQLDVLAGHDEGFGRAGKIPVTVIEQSDELTELHHKLVDALICAGAKFDDPEFVGPGYRAHVTMIDGERVRSGDRLRLRQVAIVDMEPVGPTRLRRIVWESLLGSSV